MQQITRKRGWLAAGLVLLCGLLFTSSAQAAQFASGEVYRLAADEVVTDDLYVTANEIYIDGVVQGDLIAAGSYIEINGVVANDVLVVTGGFKLSGEVQDDVRLAAVGVDISGQIGDELVAAGGGGGFPWPMEFGGRPVTPGIRLADSAQIGSDAIIGGGQAMIAGSIGGKLQAALASVTLAAKVGDSVDLSADRIEVQNNTRIGGVLRYTSDEPLTFPEGIASDIEYSPRPLEPGPDPAWVIFSWLVRTALILIGFAALAWLVLRFAPQLLLRPAQAIAAKPAQAGLYGFLAAVAFIFIPLASALLVFLMVLFWGWFPGLTLGLFLFGVLALLWFLSPLVIGVWLGRQLNQAMGRAPNYLPVLMGGVLLLALLGRIPLLGWLIYLFSFILALGGLILMRRVGGSRALGPTPEAYPLAPARPAEAPRS